MSKRQTRSLRAFTLPELMIAMTILGVIGTVLTLLYDGSYASINRGTGRLALQQRGREILRRVGPVVLSAFEDPNDPAPDDILWPPDDGNSYDSLVLSTTEDWLDPSYPSATSSARMAPDVASINYFKYRIRLENGNIDLEKGTWDDATSTFTPTGGVRHLGVSNAPDSVDAVSIEAFRAENLAKNAVRVSVDLRVVIRNAGKGQEPVNQTLATVIQIPYADLRSP